MVGFFWEGVVSCPMGRGEEERGIPGGDPSLSGDAPETRPTSSRDPASIYGSQL